MEYYAPTFLSQQNGCLSGLESNTIPTYAIPTLFPQMISMSQTSRTTEAKPRLGKEEVNILEREFSKNPKPSTQVKKVFAEEMNVDLPRINNWFQNRRAKRKQERKLKENELAQSQEITTFSSPSPDLLSHTKDFCTDNLQISNNILSTTNQKSTCSQYSSKPTETSDQSFGSHRPTQLNTINESFIDRNSYLSIGSVGCDPSEFSVLSEHDITHIVGKHSYECPINNGHGILQVDSQSFNQTHSPTSTLDNHISPSGISRHNYSLKSKSLDRLDSDLSAQLAIDREIIPPESFESSPEKTSGDSNYVSYEKDTSSGEHLGEQKIDQSSDDVLSSPYDIEQHSECLESPPAPSNISFKPRPPMNIALRRKKVRHRPAALTPDSLKSRPAAGPCTISHVEGFHLPVKSPVGSPMRKIVSAGGNRAVVSGRVQKFGLENNPRSPIYVSGFETVDGFMEHNLHNFCHPPPLTGLSSLSSSLAPSTPSEVHSAQLDGPTPPVSNVDASSNYLLSLNVPNCFLLMDEKNQESDSPKFNQSQTFFQSSAESWSDGIDCKEKQYLFEASENQEFLNFQDTLTYEPHLNESVSLSSLSQPVTPAFAPQCKPNYLIDHMSPYIENPYLAHQIENEYPYTDTTYDSGNFTHNSKNQKTFQFSNTTPADFFGK